MKLDSNAIKKVLKEQTENGATAYASTNYEIVDFNFKVPFYRNQSVEDIQLDFAKVYFENPLLALKDLFYLGDIREGLGERKIFKAGLAWLCDHEPEVANQIIPLIPEYSRWDVVVGLDNDVARKVVLEQLLFDFQNRSENKPISLLAKWMPSINTSSKETRAAARKWVKLLGVSEKGYRKALADLRAYLDVVEVKASAQNWGDINYSTVPSVANLKYKNAFLRHDTERRKEFLTNLDKEGVKINASVLYPHQIVSQYMKEHLSAEDSLLEAAWKNLPNYTAGDVLVVRDGSGSMTGQPLDVATALAIYTAQKNTGVWHNKFLTFSSQPGLVDISSANSLLDALKICDGYNDCSNTNIEATMDLILEAAVATKSELPDSVVIISDMQFDQCEKGTALWMNGCLGYESNKTDFEMIAQKYAEAGYALPRIVFWNVSAYSHGLIQMKTNANGLVEMSGFSVALLKQILSNQTDPYDVLCDMLNTPRYNRVIEAFN